jgi:hypothetical protein
MRLMEISLVIFQFFLGVCWVQLKRKRKSGAGGDGKLGLWRFQR